MSARRAAMLASFVERRLDQDRADHLFNAEGSKTLVSAVLICWGVAIDCHHHADQEGILGWIERGSAIYLPVLAAA